MTSSIRHFVERDITELQFFCKDGDIILGRINIIRGRRELRGSDCWAASGVLFESNAFLGMQGMSRIINYLLSTLNSASVCFEPENKKYQKIMRLKGSDSN